MKRFPSIVVWAINGKFKSDKSQFKNCTGLQIEETMWSWSTTEDKITCYMQQCNAPAMYSHSAVSLSSLQSAGGGLGIRTDSPALWYDTQCKGDFDCSKSTCERSLEQLCNLAMQCLLCALSVIWENTSEERPYNLRQTSNSNWRSRLLFQSIVGIPKLQTL